MFSLYEGTSLPSEPENFNREVLPARKVKQEDLTLVEVFLKLEKYAKLKVHEQINVKAGVKNMLEKCVELAGGRQTRYQFDLAISIKIFICYQNCLPRRLLFKN